MRAPIAAIVAGLALAGCQPRPPHVDHAWIRLSAVPGRPAAAYFDLTAGGASQTLLSVGTPAAIRSELHESMTRAGGMTAMTPLAQVGVPAGGTIRFAPGGKHVMLFDVDPALRPGATTTLRLSFVDGRTIAADARVLAAGDPAP